MLTRNILYVCVASMIVVSGSRDPVTGLRSDDIRTQWMNINEENGLNSSKHQERDLLSLKDTYSRWMKAWNDQDAKTVSEIGWSNFGFGRDVPFLRTGAKDQNSYEKGIKKYMESMVAIEYTAYHTDYRIVDSIGFVDGFYAQSTQQETGPLRTVYGRQSLVFKMRDGKWEILHYHRSALPNEFTR